MAFRAHLLSGLRTGGPNYDTESARSSLYQSEGGKGLKADAAPFTPGSGRANQANETQGDVATMYGSTSLQQQDMASMIRQRQAQMMQQQLLAQQQAQQQQQVS